jgi:hypothetical protein
MPPTVVVTDFLPNRTDTAQEPLQRAAPGTDEIAALAHQLWIDRGCPEGSPEEDWFHAEEELLHHQRA